MALPEPRRQDCPSRRAQAAGLLGQCQRHSLGEDKESPLQAEYWSTRTHDEVSQHQGTELEGWAGTAPDAPTGLGISYSHQTEQETT